MDIKEQIQDFIPYNEQEERDKEYYLKFIDNFEDILTRDNLFGHFSASAFVINKDRTKTLVVYHIINDGWIFPGGHADGEKDLLSVALREVEEETGLKAKVLDENIFAIQAAPVKGHVKRGKYVPAHIHYDVLYLVEADDTQALSFREDESKGVKWIDLKDATSSEFVDWVRPVNKKIIEKIQRLK